MRVLHILKTSEGALWAAAQVRELVRSGVEIHAVLPEKSGAAIEFWRTTGAVLHFEDFDVSVREWWPLSRRAQRLRSLVRETKPDIIHNHFFLPAVFTRAALGRRSSIPRVYQVAGPLHLEHAPFRMLDIRTAGPRDYWIASSRCIRSHYLRAGVQPRRVFLSYYGFDVARSSSVRSGVLRRQFGITETELVVGNVSFMYPPKVLLGQRTGIKRHEDMIDALSIVARGRSNITALLVGGQWGAGHRYEDAIRRRARAVGCRIILPGRLPAGLISQGLADFDCVIHVPTSENCGGVVEPLAAGVPTIGTAVGGIPEVVIPDVTGCLVRPRRPEELARRIETVLSDLSRYRALAKVGAGLVREMFDVRRTAHEVLEVYQYVLGQSEVVPTEYRWHRERPNEANCAAV